MNYAVYILRSRSSGKRYIGYTEDLEARLRQHNEGITPSTRKRGPWKVIYQETGYKTKKEAGIRERELKRMKGGIQLRKLLEHAGIV